MDQSRKRKAVLIVSAVLSAALLLVVLYAVNKDLISQKVERFRALHHNYEVYGGMTDELRDSDLYEDMQSGKSFCFLGDSITDGTVTYGLHWYQPLIHHIKGSVQNLSYLGWEVTDLIDRRDIIVSADVYVIAIGINDAIVAGRTGESPDKYIARCDRLANRIKNINPDAVIYFIAPWTYVGFEDKIMQSGVDFRKALEDWCSKTEYRCINPDPVITEVFAKEGAGKFMYNFFHPNAPEGIEMFSYAVLKAAHDQRTAKS